LIAGATAGYPTCSDQPTILSKGALLANSKAPSSLPDALHRIRRLDRDAFAPVRKAISEKAWRPLPQ
jgi:hypothetical protein